MLVTPRQSIDLSHIDGWIFDLDNTIYPAESGLFPQVANRMNSYLEQTFNLTEDEARAMRRDLFERFGTTGRGLMEAHQMDPAEFLSYVHDIDLSEITYDEELDQALGNLPGKKVVFTNGTVKHASRILEAYRIDHHFEYCYDIIEADHQPKPEPKIYLELLERTGISANSAIMLEDMAVNLKPAADLGITTVWLDHELDWQKEGTIAPHVDYIARDLKSFFRSMASR